MSTRLFLIEALSNLHVGSGEINYGLIDNLIQRDPISGLPNINSSSLKGALREYFSHIEKTRKNEDKPKWTVSGIFGSDPKAENKVRKQGSVRFFEAELLAIPVRCADKPYEMTTSSQTITDLTEKLKNYGLLKKEEESISKETKNELFGSSVKEEKDYEKFKRICSDDELPVISRNYLENGQSSNLWYEQVLPKLSRLCFFVMGDENDSFKAFCKDLDGARVQIGANATIGYGYCKITEIKTEN